ncbi:MAG: hypothetical protein LBU43_08290 [Candidatus Accumulibacter sp.]|nr:hypothetical protein [Accumulibacter sp.]
MYSSNTANTSPSSTVAPTNSITLLLKSNSAGNGYANSAFNASGQPGKGPSSNYYNYYDESTLQAALAGIANALGKEKDVINARDLAPITQNGGWLSGSPSDLDVNDGVNGTTTANDLLWALSYPEWVKLDDTEVRKYTASAWRLRSPSVYYGLALAGRSDGAGYVGINVLDASFAVRPAFNLDLTNVLFTSAALGNSSSFSTTTDQGDGIRLTFSDDTIATPALTLKANNAFDFSDGTVASDMYVSGFLQGASHVIDTSSQRHRMYVSGFLQGASHYYAQLAGADSGSGSFALTGVTGGVADGTYTFHVFGEETGGDFYSGFAGENVDFQAEVNNGAVERLFLLHSP